MATPPVSKLAETDQRVDEMQANMAVHQRFVADSVKKMEEASKAMLEMVTRNTSQDQSRGIKVKEIKNLFFQHLLFQRYCLQ